MGLNWEDASSVKLFNILFIGQLALDIRKKWQKVDVVDRMTISQFV